MRVLITRPEREAAALATALTERGHAPVIAPLFRLQNLAAPPEFAALLAGSQAVLLTSANGARALAEATEQRGMKIFAVGDTTASTAEGLGFSSVTAAAGDSVALVDLVRKRLDPKAGPLLHIAGADVATDFRDVLEPAGFSLHRVTLYDASEVETLPEAARTALEAGTLDAAAFFSPRASEVFVRLVDTAKLGEALRAVTAIAISPAARAPLAALPFARTLAAARPTRQAVLDEIDRLAAASVKGPLLMSDTSSSPASPPPPSIELTAVPVAPPAPVQVVRRGLGVFGAFIVALLTSAAVFAGAIYSFPYWPPELRALWPVVASAPVATPPVPPAAPSTAAIDAAKQELTQRLDDLDKRVRAASAAAAEAANRPIPTPAPSSATPATSTAAPARPDPAVAELSKRLEALENKPAPVAPAAPHVPVVVAPVGDAEKDISALRLEIATLRATLQALDQNVGAQKDEATRQREQTRAMAAAVEKATADLGARGAGEQKALGAARASAVIGVAARLSAALDSGLPFTADLGLLAPLAQNDTKLTEIIAALQPRAQAGVAARAALVAEFPAVAKAALADDLADDSFGERLLGKLKSIVSLRRVGADVQGDSVEAKLARAEAALEAGDVAKAVDLVKSLPPQTAKATTTWLARAEAHLAAKRAVDQLAAHAVTLLGAAR